MHELPHGLVVSTSQWMLAAANEAALHEMKQGNEYKDCILHAMCCILFWFVCCCYLRVRSRCKIARATGSGSQHYFGALYYGPSHGQTVALRR